MNGTRWLGIGFFVLAVAVLFTVVYMFQPPNKTVSETVWVKPNTSLHRDRNNAKSYIQMNLKMYWKQTLC